MNCLYCDNPTDQVSHLLFNCNKCPIKVSFLVINSPGETLVETIYYWFDIGDTKYWIRSDKHRTILKRKFKDVVILNHGVDLTPRSAPEFARKLLNLKAFA